MAERIEDSIPFLINCLASAGVEFASKDFAALDLSVPEARILIAIKQNMGIMVGHLSTLTFISQSTLSHMLRRLEERDLLRRLRSENDNRTVTISLTPSGSMKARRCWALATRHEEMTLRNISKRQAGDIRRLAKILLANLSKTSLEGTDEVPEHALSEDT